MTYAPESAAKRIMNLLGERFFISGEAYEPWEMQNLVTRMHAARLRDRLPYGLPYGLPGLPDGVLRPATEYLSRFIGTCLHEAGHAVAASALGCPLVWVEVMHEQGHAAIDVEKDDDLARPIFVAGLVTEILAYGSNINLNDFKADLSRYRRLARIRLKSRGILIGLFGPVEDETSETCRRIAYEDVLTAASLFSAEPWRVFALPPLPDDGFEARAWTGLARRLAGAAGSSEGHPTAEGDRTGVPDAYLARLNTELGVIKARGAEQAFLAAEIVARTRPIRSAP